MDESSFDIDARQLAEASRLFPAHRIARPAGHTSADVSYLAAGPGVEFARHAWDEAGHL